MKKNIAKTSLSHTNLLQLLQEKELKGEVISEGEILEVTGWKKITLATYLNKGQLSDFLNKISDSCFEASNSKDLSIQEFTQLLSQSKHRRGLGHNCKSRLVKALLRKSKDNMLLALELYNRPSLENRMDCFVLCFCIAWEQLLKAILLEKEGEQSIFRKTRNTGSIRETISLRDCLDRVYNTDDLVRKNIEKIVFYRDQAVHLLMPELQGIMSRVFQSGILNYSTKFQEFTQQPFISSNYSGMLSLVGDLRQPSIATLHNSYGKELGDEILSLVNSLTEEAKSLDDIEFAIPLNVKLVFTKQDEQGNIITLAKADDGIEGLKKAIILEKPTDRDKTHPYKESDAIREINRRFYEKYDAVLLESRLVKRNKETQRPEINTHCFRSVVSKLKWRNSNNKYHYMNKDPEYHYYSDCVVEEFIDKVVNIDGYLKKARESNSSKKSKK
jgi:EC042_2821-lke REase/Protein of unknown function (DUF3644)